MKALKLRVNGCADADDWDPIAAYIREIGKGIARGHYGCSSLFAHS
jgi:hypothetical protein